MSTFQYEFLPVSISFFTPVFVHLGAGHKVQGGGGEGGGGL